MSLIGKKIIIAGADFTDIAVSGQETKTLQSIAITTNPTKTTYGVGEQLNLAGLVVTATLIGDTSGTISQAVISNYTTSPANGAILDTAGTVTVTVSYTHRDVTKTATFNVTVIQVTVYTITKTITNGTATGDDTIIEDGTASITLTANSGYVLPDSITVAGATYTYSKATGVVSLSNPTSNVTITAVCEEQSTDWKDEIILNGKTYREIFLNGNKFNGGDFIQNNDLSWWNGPVTVTKPTVDSTNGYVGAQCLTVDAASSIQAGKNANDMPSLPVGTYYGGCFVNCSRYTKGELGMQLKYNGSGDLTFTSVHAVTDGWQLVSRYQTNCNLAGSELFIGSMSSANLAGKLDGFILINCEDVFGSGNIPTQAQLDAAFNSFVEQWNAHEN